MKTLITILAASAILIAQTNGGSAENRQNHSTVPDVRLVTVLGRHLGDMMPGGPTSDEIRELKPVLYGLDAILRLHFAQEDESYLALIEARAQDRTEPTVAVSSETPLAAASIETKGEIGR